MSVTCSPSIPFDYAFHKASAQQSLCKSLSWSLFALSISPFIGKSLWAWRVALTFTCANLKCYIFSHMSHLPSKVNNKLSLEFFLFNISLFVIMLDLVVRYCTIDSKALSSRLEHHTFFSHLWVIENVSWYICITYSFRKFATNANIWYICIIYSFRKCVTNANMLLFRAFGSTPSPLC